MFGLWVIGGVGLDCKIPVIGGMDDVNASPNKASSATSSTTEIINCCYHLFRNFGW
jgi:hypothetical protein